MAQYPIPNPEPAERVTSGGNQSTGTPHWTREAAQLGLDLAELTATFSSEEGGNLSPELSADLAMEVVLNEIVEQACCLTGATGAAVILERKGQWVCRASSGAGAPELGARLSSESGLTAECIKTQRVQRCSDVEKDRRADVEACRALGVRSVLIIPLLHGEKLIGVMAAFSQRVFGFGEEDERNLKVLSNYVISSLVQTSESPVGEQSAEGMPALEAAEEGSTEIPAAVNPATKNGILSENGIERKLIPAPDLVDPFKQRPESLLADSHWGVKAATWILAALVLTFAVFLTAVAGQRLLGGKLRTRGSLPIAPSRSSFDQANQGKEKQIERVIAATGGQSAAVGSSPASVSSVASATPEGSLSVYEDAKVVFHIPPAPEKSGSNAEAENNKVGTQSAAAQPGMYELSPEVAQGDVLFRVDPEYPEQARDRGIQGIVVLSVRAGRDGRVEEVRLVGGQPLLVEAAITAVKQWQFKPHLIDGKPVETQTRITLTFELPR
jgi:TonB family protein